MQQYFWIDVLIRKEVCFRTCTQLAEFSRLGHLWNSKKNISRYLGETRGFWDQKVVWLTRWTSGVSNHVNVR